MKKVTRLTTFVVAAMASMLLVLSGCATTSAKPNDGPGVPGTSQDNAPKRDGRFGGMETAEDMNGNAPDGQTLLGPSEAVYAKYSYGNRARTVDFKHAVTDAYECIPLNALYEFDWEINIGALESAGYTVDSVCELSLDQVELMLAYESGLFDHIDMSDEYLAKGYGGTIYSASDADGFYYYIFVPSWSLVNDYGEQGVLTADYIFCYQEDIEFGGPVEVYYNLTPDEARDVFYDGQTE